MKALVFRGKIVQIEAKEFPVHEALKWVDITGVAPAPRVGWSYDGVDFTAPPILPPDPPSPITAEEVWAVLEANSFVTEGQRPRPKAAQAQGGN